MTIDLAIRAAVGWSYHKPSPAGDEGHDARTESR